VPMLLELYEKLKLKLKEEARSLLEFIEAGVEGRAATKDDLQRVEAVLQAEIQYGFDMQQKSGLRRSR